MSRAPRAVRVSLGWLLISTVLFVGGCGEDCGPLAPKPQLLIAFPVSATQLRLVFSEPVDPVTAQLQDSYETESGLSILGASVSSTDPTRVTLDTDPMDGAALLVDVVRAPGVRTASGRPLGEIQSPEFIHGVVSIRELLRAHEPTFPYASRYTGRVATASCGKNGGVWSGTLALGHTYLHEVQGGPYSSLKVVTDLVGRIPNVVEAHHELDPGMTLHILWAGGVIRHVNGEFRLVDTGYMEGSLLPALPTPPAYPIEIATLAADSVQTATAYSLESVIVQTNSVSVEEVGTPDDRGIRTIVVRDDGGAQLRALLLSPVTIELTVGQRLHFTRALVDRPTRDTFQLLVEWDGAIALE